MQTTFEDEETRDRRHCTNMQCSLRMSCARVNDEDYKSGSMEFHRGLENGVSCSYFVLRRALGRENPDLVFTEARKRGRRHNAHAYTGPRKSYPGSEALFGAKLANAMRGRRSAVGTKPAIQAKRPDLMVTNHIREGRNIKEDE